MGESGYTLYCVAGPKSGTVVNLPVEGLGIGRGRSGAGIPWFHVPDQDLSPHHADLEWIAEKRAFRFRNRARTNLSRINRQLISGELELPETSHLGLGSSQFILHKKSRSKKPPAERDERTSDYCVQLLPGGYREHLAKEDENAVGLNMVLVWEPRWGVFVARAKGQSRLTVSRKQEEGRADFPFRKPVALEVGDVLVADFCRYEFLFAEPTLNSRDLRKFRSPRGLIPGYLRLEKLGQGNSSEVFLMLDPDGRKVAVKFLLPHLQHDVEARASFEREGQTALSFRHECLLDVLQVGTNDAQEKFMISEYMSEGSVRDTLARDGSLPYPEVKDICLDLASGLAYLHKRKVVHRDVKPSNIFRHGERTVLGDFGIVKGLDRGSAESTGFTVGTPGYMAPEHFRGRTEPRSDQYALGVVLVECLTGRPMFETDDPMALAHMSEEERAKPLELLPGELPENARSAILRMLSYLPEERYGDVLEAAGEFS